VGKEIVAVPIFTGFATGLIKSTYDVAASIYDRVVARRGRAEETRRKIYDDQIGPFFEQSEAVVSDLFGFFSEIHVIVDKSRFSPGSASKFLIEPSVIEILRRKRAELLAKRIAIIRTQPEDFDAAALDQPERYAIRDMVHAMHTIIVGREGERTSRPQSFIDALSIVLDHQRDGEIPGWIADKFFNPHLTRSVTEAETLWGDVSRIAGQLRHFCRTGRRPDEGYHKLSIFSLF